MIAIKKNVDKESLKIDLSNLFKSDKEFYELLEQMKKKISEISKYEGKIFENDNSLYEMLELDEQISIDIESLHIYAHIHNDCDLSESKSSIMYGKVMNLYNKYSKISSFITPEIMEKDYEYIENLYKKCSNLKKFKNMLEQIYRLKNHVLSKEQNFIIAQLSDSLRAPDAISSKLVDCDIHFGKIKNEKNEDVELTSSNYGLYAQSDNREVRKDAFNAMFTTFKNYKTTLAESFAMHVKNQNSYAKLKKYSNAFEKSLTNNNIELKIYDNLINSVNKNLKILQKQYTLRKEVLDLSELHLYDMSAPISKSNLKNFTFDEARDMVLGACSVLGDEYVYELKKFFDNNWIDVLPKENKRSGAYCTCAYKSSPYVFLNYEGDYNNVSTLAHELGHAMHYHYSQKNNSYTDYNYSIFVAEVASQVNEILLNKYMQEKSTKEDKLFLTGELLSDFRSTVSRQTMFAEFEKNVYFYELDDNIITSDYLSKEYLKLVKKYFGKNVVIDEDIAHEWARIPHFYYNFYVYQYAIGFIAAFLIAENIYNKEAGELENYLKFLTLGSTLDPVSQLRVAGINVEDEEFYNKAFLKYEEILKNFKNIRSSEEK